MTFQNNKGKEKILKTTRKKKKLSHLQRTGIKDVIKLPHSSTGS